MNKQDLILEIKKIALLKIAQSTLTPAEKADDAKAAAEEADFDKKHPGFDKSHSTSITTDSPAPPSFDSDSRTDTGDKAPARVYDKPYVAPAQNSVGKLQSALKNLSSIVNKTNPEFKQFVEDHSGSSDAHNPVGSIIEAGPKIVIDAKWGPITNGALLSASGLGEILVQLNSDFPTSHKYSFDAEGFKSLLTEEVPSSTEASELAPKLIEFVNHLSTFYKQYSFDFLKNPEYKRLMHGGNTVFKIKPAEKDLGKLPEGYEDPKVYGPRVLRNVVLPTPGGSVNIPLLNLSYIDTLEHLRSLMTEKLGYKAESITDQAIKAVFNALKAHVDNESAKISMTPATAPSGTSVRTDTSPKFNNPIDIRDKMTSKPKVETDTTDFDRSEE